MAQWPSQGAPEVHFGSPQRSNATNAGFFMSMQLQNTTNSGAAPLPILRLCWECGHTFVTFNPMCFPSGEGLVKGLDITTRSDSSLYSTLLHQIGRLRGWGLCDSRRQLPTKHSATQRVLNIEPHRTFMNLPCHLYPIQYIAILILTGSCWKKLQKGFLCMASCTGS